MKSIGERKRTWTKSSGIKLGLIALFMALVLVPGQNQLLAQTGPDDVNSPEEKKPTIEDIYRILEEIKAKLEEKEKREGQMEIDGELTGIKITGWSLYVAWGVPIIHHVTIENTSDLAYKDIKVSASYYYSYSNDRVRTETATAEGILPITLPPNSKETYYKNGIILARASAASMYGGPKSVDVESAIPVIEKDLFSFK